MKFFIFIFISFSFISALYSADFKNNNDRDPFEPLIPAEVTDAERREGKVSSIASLPPLNIQGVIWGGDFAQAIIEGEVYKVGDTLKNIKAKVFRIEKSTIFLSYKSKIYKVKTKTREAR